MKFLSRTLVTTEHTYNVSDMVEDKEGDTTIIRMKKTELDKDVVPGRGDHSSSSINESDSDLENEVWMITAESTFHCDHCDKKTKLTLIQTLK